MARKVIPTYNKEAIAARYGISVKTLNAWMKDEDFLKEFGKYRGKTFTPKQVDLIADNFGHFDGYQKKLEM